MIGIGETLYRRGPGTVRAFSPRFGVLCRGVSLRRAAADFGADVSFARTDAKLREHGAGGGGRPGSRGQAQGQGLGMAGGSAVPGTCSGQVRESAMAAISPVARSVPCWLHDCARRIRARDGGSCGRGRCRMDSPAGAAQGQPGAAETGGVLVVELGECGSHAGATAVPGHLELGRILGQCRPANGATNAENLALHFQSHPRLTPAGNPRRAGQKAWTCDSRGMDSAPDESMRPEPPHPPWPRGPASAKKPHRPPMPAYWIVPSVSPPPPPR